MSFEVPDQQTFNQKQNGIYDNFMNAQAGIAVNGVEVDAGGTALQSGFLVAFRPPENVARKIADFSRTLSEAVPSVLYGKDDSGLDNAHVTLSDLDVQPNRVLSYEDPRTNYVLRELGSAVVLGLRNVGGSEALSETRIRMDGAFHNGKVAIIPGQANLALYEVRKQVLVAGNRLGVQEFGEKGFNGAWGLHSTISRALEAYGPESEQVQQLLAAMGGAPTFGEVTPDSIDVGYFNTDPINGFVFTPWERFKPPKNAATNISMHFKTKAAQLPELLPYDDLDPQRIEALQQAATVAALRGSVRVLEGQLAKDQGVVAKGEGLVSESDYTSEDEIRMVLREAGGDIQILGEERGLSDGATEASDSPLEGLGHRIIWIVDPKDGTRPDINGVGTSTVIVAAWDKVTKRFIATTIVHPQSGRVVEASNGKTFLSRHKYETGVRSEPQPTTVWQPGEADTSSPTIFIENFQAFQKVDGQTGVRRDVMTLDDILGLQRELNVDFAPLNPGSNGLHYALLATGYERVAGMITTSISNPGDIAGLLAVQNSGGTVQAFRVNEKRELEEVENPHDVLDNPDSPSVNAKYDIVVAAVNDEVAERLVQDLRNSFNKPNTGTERWQYLS
ncbi:MAG TPA: inositol monophosphatase family protein [Candidatus Saccharimonadales bacterium]|nr:inositol monophosphatase family protein [Candidatus Saccharimonadales bacterium]